MTKKNNLSKKDFRLLNKIAKTCKRYRITEEQKVFRVPTVDAVIEYIKPTFKYVHRYNDEKISYTKLLAEGGNCRNWSDFYMDLAKFLNISATRVVIPIIPNAINHEFVVYSDDMGYSIIDQTDVKHVACDPYYTAQIEQENDESSDTDEWENQ